MLLDEQIPPEIAAEVEAAETEAARAAVEMENAAKPKRKGRPPKGKCQSCGEPLAIGKMCPCRVAADVPAEAPPPVRPAWEPLPIVDLRERLAILAQSGVESYKDGPIEITINQQARLADVAKQEGQRTRW